MQTRRQSRLEVGADFGVSLLINLVTQGLFYGVLATAGRSLAFAAMVLGLAVPRRYAIRRLFNARLAPGTRQARAQSWCEVGVDTVLAILLAILLQRWCYDTAATWSKASAVTVALYAITMGRRYVLRRLFETRNGRQAEAPPYGQPMSSGLSSSSRAPGDRLKRGPRVTGARGTVERVGQ
jgi:hypothetical protein